MVTKTPEFLKQNDKIAIISTARSIETSKVKAAVELIELWGFRVVLGNTIGVSQNQFAGSTTERAKDLQMVLDDPSIKAIWMARGGYGSIQVIDQIDFNTFQKKPKWIIGYSDITIFHSHIHNFGIKTLHACMPVDFFNCTKETTETLRLALKGSSYHFHFKSDKKNRRGTAKGELVGGNLSILYSLCGTSSAMDFEGKILCIEDLDEFLYHIERMLYTLKRNRYFDELKGLIVGGMTKLHDNEVSFGKEYKQIILDITKEYNFPVAFEAPFGHIEDNQTLILGAAVELKVEREETIITYI